VTLITESTTSGSFASNFECKRMNSQYLEPLRALNHMIRLQMLCYSLETCVVGHQLRATGTWLSLATALFTQLHRSLPSSNQSFAPVPVQIPLQIADEPLNPHA
jgi:hypothetical protein